MRRMRSSTSVWSAICGIHFGDTKAVASTAGRPGVGEPLDQFQLDRGRDFALFVLQSVARADFDDADSARAGRLMPEW